MMVLLSLITLTLASARHHFNIHERQEELQSDTEQDAIPDNDLSFTDFAPLNSTSIVCSTYSDTNTDAGSCNNRTDIYCGQCSPGTAIGYECKPIKDSGLVINLNLSTIEPSKNAIQVCTVSFKPAKTGQTICQTDDAIYECAKAANGSSSCTDCISG